VDSRTTAVQSSNRIKGYKAESNELVALRSWGMADRRREQQSSEKTGHEAA
jgi:hypothetical protein